MKNPVESRLKIRPFLWGQTREKRGVSLELGRKHKAPLCGSVERGEDMKKIIHWCLVFSFLLGMNLPFVSRGSSLYFTVVNDTILPLNSNHFPVWVDGFIYLPYTVFDVGTTGSSLGTQSTYQKSTNLVTVYTDTSTLIFDLEGGYCVNGITQSVFPYRAVMENGIPYLPMTIVCNFFRITFSYHSTSSGSVVRLEKGTGNLNAARFLIENEGKMADMVKEYEQGPTVTLPSEPEPEPVVDTPFCLGFWVGEEDIDFADTLENWKVYGVFFFTEEQLRSQGNYLRKLVAMGHSIGISLVSTGIEDALVEAEVCNELLRAQTMTTTQIVSGSSGLANGLKGEKYILWQGGSGKEISNPTAVVTGLKQGATMEYLSLQHNETTQKNWTQLMNLLGEEQFIPQIPLENNLV